MKHFAIIGYPLKHTLSPVLHQKLARQLGVSLEYSIKEISHENLEGSMKNLLELDGFNVTIPYKIEIEKYLDKLDVSAQKHGAVNVVSNENGVHTGYNTDCIGFVRCIERAGIPLEGKVCVIGLGGVGRMFATECACRGCQVTFAVKQKHLDEMKQLEASGRKSELRQLQKEIEAISRQPVEILAAEEVNGKYDLLINASPVGMYPNTEPSPMSREQLKNMKAVFDCIYNPRETTLLRMAREEGCMTCGGMAMLVWQAVAAQEIWLHTSFAPEQVEKVMQEMEEVL